MDKGVPCKGFFETLKIYRKLHFQAVKRKLELGYIVQVLFRVKKKRRARRYRRTALFYRIITLLGYVKKFEFGIRKFLLFKA